MNQENDDNTQTHIVFTKGAAIAQYRIIERLGAGGMGEVYLAEDTKLNRRVALKFLSFQHSQNEELKARFMREAQAAASLSHPNIVHIYEVSEYQGRPYFAMEYVHGKSLHIFAHEEPLSISEIINIAIECCDGLSKAHEIGILHRDIKSSNIVLDADGHPKILDFGLATISGAEKITKAGSTIGTIAYMSPERVEGKKGDHRSDLFSFGVVLYELIAGRTPFRRDSEAATLKAIVDDIPEPLARYRAGVPDEVQQIIDKLLDKDPKTRYQTAAGVAADLIREKRLLDSGEVTPSIRSKVTYKRDRISALKKLVLSSTTLAAIVIILLVLKPWKFNVEPTEEVTAAENRLAVMYFENLVDPADTDRLSEIISNLLVTYLSESKNLRVVSSQRMYDLLKQVGKEDSRSVDRETATEVAVQAGATWMLTGSILQTEPEVVITTQVIDVGSGQVVTARKSKPTSEEDIFAQVGRLAAELKDELVIPGTDGEKSSLAIADVTTHSQEAYKYYLEGEDYIRKLYMAEATQSFLKAIEVDSTFATAYYLLARFNLVDSKSEEHLRKAVKYSSKTTELERLYILSLADYRAGDYDVAIEGYLDIVRRFPDEKNAYLNLADVYSRIKGDSKKSLDYYQEALKIDPLDKNIFNNMAYIYKENRDYDKSLDALDKYISIAPNEPNPYDSRGEIYASAGKFDLAIESYRQALTKDPGFQNALMALVRIYTFLGDYSRADSCAQALAGDADKKVRSAGRTLLPFSFLHRGRFKDAIRVLDESVAADKMEQVRSQAYVNKLGLRAYILLEMGQYDEALKEFEEMSRLAPENLPENPFYFQLEYAQALAQAGEVTRALDVLGVVGPSIKKGRSNVAKSLLLQAQGRIEIERENYGKAIEHLEKSLPLSKRMARPRGEYFLAIAYLKNGDAHKAIELLERLTSQMESVFMWNPIYAVKAHYQLGIAYESEGDQTKAEKQYETLLRIWKDADTETTEIKDARARLASLKS